MATEIGALHVRHSIWIDAEPAEVWREFESFERMRAWHGTGHTLLEYEPRAGGRVETDAASDRGGGSGDGFRFAGRVPTFYPPREVTFEQDWLGHGWPAPALITIRLAALDGGTLVELFHHGFERFGPDAAENHRGFEGGWDTRQLEALRARVDA